MNAKAKRTRQERQPDPLSTWPAFASAVLARLERGRATYRDESFRLPPAALGDEIEAELFDVCAWSFILWERVRALTAALNRDVKK